MEHADKEQGEVVGEAVGAAAAQAGAVPGEDSGAARTALPAMSAALDSAVPGADAPVGQAAPLGAPSVTGDVRRAQIVLLLQEASKPISGQVLGEKLQVSRQVIVTDVALLRACGHDIVSTNRGYVLKRSSTQVARLVKVRHTPEQIEDELDAIVDLGGCVVDVMVNHRTYGRLSAPLDVKSRRDVRQFLSDLNQGISAPLSTVTDGYHFHHISAASDDIVDEIISALEEKGFLAPLTDYEAQELFS